MEIHRLKKEYTLYINSFLQWAQSAGAAVQVSAQGPISANDLGNGQIEICSLIHLDKWPYKPGTTKPNAKISILIQSREVYEKNHVLVQSNVNMLYFKPTKQGEPACPDVAIHYDYEYQMGDAHPIFHAQFGARKIPPEKLQEVSFDRALDLSGYSAIASIRIPTVHVGLPATLLAVTADHLEKTAYRGFLEFASKQPFFNTVSAIRLDQCREKRLHDQDQWVYRSHNIYM